MERFRQRYEQNEAFASSLTCILLNSQGTNLSLSSNPMNITISHKLESLLFIYYGWCLFSTSDVVKMLNHTYFLLWCQKQWQAKCSTQSQCNFSYQKQPVQLVIVERWCGLSQSMCGQQQIDAIPHLRIFVFWGLLCVLDYLILFNWIKIYY